MGKAIVIRRLCFRCARNIHVAALQNFHGKLVVYIIGIQKYRLLLWVEGEFSIFLLRAGVNEGGGFWEGFILRYHVTAAGQLFLIPPWLCLHFQIVHFLFFWLKVGGEMVLCRFFPMYPSFSTFVERQRSWLRELHKGR